jgi:hypothetical protein
MPTQATLRMTAAMRGGGVTTAGIPEVTRRTGPVGCVPVVDTLGTEDIGAPRAK